MAGLRVGLVTELCEAEGIEADVSARLAEAAAALEHAGAKVDEASVPTAVYGLSAYYLIAPAEASSNLARYDGVRFGLRVDAPTTGEMYDRTRTEGFGAEVKRRIMLGTYALSAGYYDAFYGKAQRVRTLILRDFAAAYEDFDVLLSPTSPSTAFPLGAKTADPLTMYLNDVCTIPSNLAGHPAISVPFGTGDDGLPVGVQVMAPALQEALLFRVAAAARVGGPLEPPVVAPDEIGPGAGGGVPGAHPGGRQRPGDPQVGIVVAHRAVFARVVSPVDPIADVGLLGQHLEAVQQARRDVHVQELLVVQAEGLVPAERRRPRTGVDHDVVDRTAGAAYELRLAQPRPGVEAAQRGEARSRLRILHERGRVDAVLGRHRGVERAREEASVVAVGRGREHEHARQRRRPHLHPIIMAGPVQRAIW